MAASITEVKLKGAKVRLGEPIQVTQTIGRAWFPTIAQFPTGELVALYALTEDTHTPGMVSSGFQLSTDGGKTWGHRYDIIPEFGSTIFHPLEDGSLLLIPHILYRKTSNDQRNFHGLYTRFEAGGRRIVMEPAGLRVVDWPWPVEAHVNKTPTTNWLLELRFDGNVVKVGNRWVASMYGKKPGEKFYRVMVSSSQDQGRTWRYLSTVADGSVLGDLKDNEGAEGPSEAGMIQLADGDLMIAYRLGGSGWNLGRSYSKDGGRSWSKADLLPAVGVEPSLVRTQNGTIALSTGRPGLFLWLSTDERASEWQQFDIMEYHNRWAPDAGYKISFRSPEDPQSVHRSTAYTEMIEVAPNRLLLIYDRTASGWEATSADSDERNRIFTLPVEIVRE
jgi:hypothetical protein